MSIDHLTAPTAHSDEIGADPAHLGSDPTTDAPPAGRKRSGRRASAAARANSTTDRATAKPDVPPSIRAARSGAGGRSTAKVAEQFTGLYGAVGVGLVMAGRPTAGHVVAAHAEAAGEAWAAVAAANPKVAAAVEKFMAASSWTPLILVHVTMAQSMVGALQIDAATARAAKSTMDAATRDRAA